MTFVGLSGQTYSLAAKPFRGGGEGDIYDIVGAPDRCAKIYHPAAVSTEVEQKLSVMMHQPPGKGVISQVAWPLDLLYDARRAFAGFVMPKLNMTASLSELYQYPPVQYAGVTTQQKLIIAENICAVISEVHKAGYVFGDFNPGNIGIDLSTGRVAFLDTDSYHIHDPRTGKTYRCKVCMNGYVAPELLQTCRRYENACRQQNLPGGDAYAKAPLPTFTVETDDFALAIHIFKLLMNGYTPFNGIKETETASSASPGVDNVAIERDSYCFKPGNKPLAVAVPPLEALPDEIGKLFARAFIDGRKDPRQRPTAVEWHAALLRYEQCLTKGPCPRGNPAHQYKNTLTRCPWCEADDRYAEQLSPRLTQRAFTAPVVPVSPPGTGSGQGAGKGRRISRSSPLPGASVAAGGYGASGGRGTVYTGGASQTRQQPKKKGWVIAIVAAVLCAAVALMLQGLDTNTRPSGQEVQEPVNAARIDVPAAAEQTMTIDSLAGDRTATGEETGRWYSGSLLYDRQIDSYGLVPSVDGAYRFELSNMMSGTVAEIYVLDSLNQTVDSLVYCENGEGITVEDLKAGQTYNVQVRQDEGYSNYTLYMGLQKSTVDISGVTALTDAVRFIGQRNKYSFTVPMDGRYSFGISNMTSGTVTELYILNDRNEVVEDSVYFENGDALILDNAKAGEVYSVQVWQDEGLSDYTLSIGRQKPGVEVGNNTVVTDWIEYEGQYNWYIFTAQREGRVDFTVSGMPEDMYAELYIWNDTGETVRSDTHCENGDVVRLDGVQAGASYIIQVCQDYGTGPYCLTIN